MSTALKPVDNIAKVKQLEVGQEIELYSIRGKAYGIAGPRGSVGSFRLVKGEVVYVGKNFFTVLHDNGYRESFQNVDLITGQVRIVEGK